MNITFPLSKNISSSEEIFFSDEEIQHYIRETRAIKDRIDKCFEAFLTSLEGSLRKGIHDENQMAESFFELKKEIIKLSEKFQPHQLSLKLLSIDSPKAYSHLMNFVAHKSN